jgi:hypothetical protein
MRKEAKPSVITDKSLLSVAWKEVEFRAQYKAECDETKIAKRLMTTVERIVEICSTALSSSTHDAVLRRPLPGFLQFGFSGFFRVCLSHKLLLGFMLLSLAIRLPLLNVCLRECNRGWGTSEHGDDID